MPITLARNTRTGEVTIWDQLKDGASPRVTRTGAAATGSALLGLGAFLPEARS